ncbi:hypothetical protein RCL_jg281.t1 [Rhizophagus clarus]|uniref:Uncharacterized protein n=1 Tax=Rhizophagus clarus TaxID=94130 RepID=A0A8H3LZC7_9GLOM|nr:hypothetical protein RCL_jg281.t1 [Rhizophagus clarus]
MINEILITFKYIYFLPSLFKKKTRYKYLELRGFLGATTFNFEIKLIDLKTQLFLVSISAEIQDVYFGKNSSKSFSTLSFIGLLFILKTILTIFLFLWEDTTYYRNTHIIL